MRLRSRFSALFAVLAAATALLLIVLMDGTLRRAVEDRMAGRISEEMDHVAQDLSGIPAERPEERDAFLRRTARELSCRITAIRADGRVLHDTDLLAADVPRMENHADRPEVRQARRNGTGVARRFSTTEQEERIYFAHRLPASEILRFSVPAARVRQIESGYLWSARAAICVACFLFFVIGSVASRRFSEPIAELTRAASAIAAGEHGRDLPRAGGEEVQQLAGSLQRMKDSLARAAEEARSERRLTAMVFEQLPDGLVVLDSKLHVLEANRRFAQLVGVASPSGRALYDLLRHRGLLEIFETTLRTREAVERTLTIAEGIVWQVTVVPLPEGSRGAAVGVVRDVTRFERAESMRRRFVADVSHELRTPIASIAAAAETLADRDTEKAEAARLVEMIERQADRMRELIGDLMDLAQIESGGVQLQEEDISLPALLEEIAEDLGGAAAANGIALRIEAGDSVFLHADRRRLAQILRNLTDNAIKFSPSGGTVRLRSGRDGEGPFVSVSDEGLGIPRAEREKIFQRFYQVDRSRSKSRPGSGLGLAIVKHLVQLQAGQISVQSEPGLGSTFRVSFPRGG